MTTMTVLKTRHWGSVPEKFYSIIRGVMSMNMSGLVKLSEKCFYIQDIYTIGQMDYYIYLQVASDSVVVHFIPRLIPRNAVSDRYIRHNNFGLM